MNPSHSATKPDTLKNEKMKAVIIGGGVAGLATGISLRKIGWEVIVNERAPKYTEIGLGFILLPNGLRALEELGAGPAIRQTGKALKKAILKNQDGEICRKESMEPSMAIQRYDCINSLADLLPEECICFANEFSHFIYNDFGKATTVVYKNGVEQTADIFIAADGCNSVIRRSLFPEYKTKPTVIKELVCIADLPEMAEMLNGNLVKTQSETEGLSFGMVPCNDEQIIWYMQYDSSKNDMTTLTADSKREFAKKMLDGLPFPIEYVLNHSNFDKAFVWSATDMDLLPSFHSENIVLVGDAAHLALPFTSQGTNSALEDAIILADLLEGQTKNFGEVFTEFYYSRKDVLYKYLEFGRVLADRFLQPQLFVNDEVLIPLAK
jgi:2-polyprenyl-6-methoxyphenol hydroxylase-like FAD-dependent oxidoreductase